MRLLVAPLLLLTACDAFSTRDEDFQIPASTPSIRPSPTSSAQPRPTFSPTTVSSQRGSTKAYADVRAGDGHACALTAEGDVDCWGKAPNDPQWKLDEIAVRDGTFCGLTATGALRCWGDVTGYGAPAEGPLHALGLGYRFACALDDTNHPRCWGPRALTAPDVVLTSLAVGWSHACGLREDNTTVCWGNVGGAADPPAGIFQQLVAGGLVTCGLDFDRRVTCWGDITNRAPLDRLAWLSVGNGVACGVRASDSAIVCWGGDLAEIVTKSPPGRYTNVSVGTDHACAIRVPDNKVVCWGANDDLQSYPP